MASRKVARLGLKKQQGYLYFVDRSGDVWAVNSIKSNIEKEKVLIAQAGVAKKENCLYYLDKDGDVCEVQMNRSGKHRKSRENLARPTIKYIVYEQINRTGKIFRSKKILLAQKARNIAITVPENIDSKYGVLVNYEGKNKGIYSPISKFVGLAKSASCIRIVNKIPRKYLS